MEQRQSFLKRATSFIRSYFKPNSDVSSIRMIMLILLPIEVIFFLVSNACGVTYNTNATTIFITVFSITAAMTLGPIFIEHAIDKVGEVVKAVKELRYGHNQE